MKKDVLQELIDLLALERIEENLFRGPSQDLGWGTVFGGQVLGQALSAAAQTVPPDRLVHSLHAYFLRPGAVDRPIVYDVDRIRDGRSFTTRRVVAIQSGRPIFNLAASFQVEEEGFEHQDELPEAPGPDGLLSEQDLARVIADRIPPKMRERALADRPIESRPVEPQNPFKPAASAARRMVWFKAMRALPDDPALHRYLLAYASDFSFLGVAMQPHGVSWLTPGMHVASIDHTMYFHRPLRMDEWLLHVVESPSASGGRGLVRGRWFDRQGRLVATTAQEGLIRRKAPRAG
ncbi:MAG: acyl-CoA thioesterase II [bacterium]